MAANYEALKRKRGTCRGVLTKALNELETAIGQNSDAIPELVAKVQDKSSRLETVTSEAEALEATQMDDDEFSTSYEEAEKYRDRVLTLLSKVNLKDDNVSISTSTSSSNQITSNLPKLELPSFDGRDITEFPAWWDIFSSEVDTSDLPAIKKFAYLRSNLSGKALSTIDGYKLEAKNYSSAKNALLEAFNRPSLMIQLHWNKLQQELRPVKSNDVIQLRTLYNQIESNLRALESLKEPLDNGYLPHHILSLFPNHFAEAWEREERKSSGDQYRKLERLRLFLKNELETKENAQYINGAREMQMVQEPQRAATSFFLAKNKNLCPACNGEKHSLGRCAAFIKLNLSQKRDCIRTSNLCWNCLGTNHRVKECKSISCHHCNEKHHSSICNKKHNYNSNTGAGSNSYGDQGSKRRTFVGNGSKGNSSNNVEQNGINKKENQDQEETKKTLNSSAVLGSRSSSSSILRTAVVKVEGLQRLARILFDSGSEETFVTEELVHEIQAPKIDEAKFVIETFGGKKTEEIKRDRVKFTVIDRFKGKQYEIKAWTIDYFCSPLAAKTKEVLPKQFHDLELAETFDGNEMKIDIVIGIDCFPEVFLPEEPIKLHGIRILSSIFGFIVEGKNRSGRAGNRSICSIVKAFRSGISQQNNLEVLWDMDSIGLVDEKPTPMCVPEFNEDSNRYAVELPWKSDSRPSLPLYVARNRLNGKMHRNLDLEKQRQYQDIITEWLNLGIIEPVAKDGGNYLPHHPVHREGGGIRIVLDGSAKFNGHSINDHLDVGPNLIQDLLKVIVQFRFMKHAVTCDIEKAYLMVEVSEIDRNFLKILIKDINGEETSYRFCRVPFGLSCGSYLLHVTLKKHLEKEFNIYPRTVDKINNGRFVDDILSGGQTTSEANDFRNETVEIMGRAGMNVKKFRTSDPDLRKIWMSSDDPQTKVVGLGWNTNTDELSIDLKVLQGKHDTKREILSRLSKVFDPLGIMAPFTIRGRMILQDLWKSGEDWDENINQISKEKWEEFIEEVSDITKIKFPRHCAIFPNSQLFIFGDASEKAYCVTAYIGENLPRDLLFAKARVAPCSPTMSIPRLELIAAVLSTRIGSRLKEEIPELKDSKTSYFSDSQAVLGWIRGGPKDRFIDNRISEIRKQSMIDEWSYIPSELNPADIGTRGIKLKELMKNNLWWHGPSHIPQEYPQVSTKQTRMLAIQVETEPFSSVYDITRSSSYVKSVNVIGWIGRFIKNCKLKRNGGELKTGPLNVMEFREAKLELIRQSQHESYTNEWNILSNGEILEGNDLKNSSLLLLHPKWDTSTKCIVGNPRNGQKEKPIISEDSALLKLFTSLIHKTIGHQGISSTTAEIRRTLWIPRKLKSRVKKILSKCTPCNKINSRSFKPTDEAALPEFRVNESRPFAHCGIDHFGPMLDSDGIKVWGLLFTCAVIRAVHVELVDGLDEETTALAIRKFMAIRGKPDLIYSDNGASFKSLSVVTEIPWRRIPERSAWWGGFYERMVGTVKRSMKSTLGNSAMKREELATVILELCERINRRPLVDNNETDPITPAHFIYGSPPPALFPASVVPEIPSNIVLGDRWRHRNKVSNDLWKRWKDEYLHTLSIWRGGYKGRRVPQPGELVIVAVDNYPRGKWPLAKVESLIQGRDGVVRAVWILTRGRVTRRPIQHLYPIEVVGEVREHERPVETEGVNRDEEGMDMDSENDLNFKISNRLRKLPVKLSDYELG